MKLNDFLDVLDLDTFIKVRYEHWENFEYVGSTEECYIRDEDLIVKNVSVVDDELIIVISVNDEED